MVLIIETSTERREMLARIGRPTVLRRRSWPILFGIATVALGIGMAAAVYKVTSVNGFRSGWQGIPIFLAIAGILGRIASCKVVMRDGSLMVVNPLRTHVVSKDFVHSAAVNDDGTLEVRLTEGDALSSFAFGGSLIDRFRGTSDAAAVAVNGWLQAESSVSEVNAERTARWTRCRAADWAILAGFVSAGCGAAFMALGS